MRKHFPNKTVIVAGQPVQATAIEEALQAQLTALVAATTARTAWMHAVQQQREQYASIVKPYVEAVRHYAAVMFGTSSPEYQDFGFQPPKKGIRTVMSKAKATLQNLATRKARGTVGPKAKQSIQGVIEPEAPAQAMKVTANPSTPTTPASGTSNGSSGQHT